MFGEISVEADGKTHRLVLTVGACRQMEDVNPYLTELHDACILGVVKVREIEALFDAALSAGSASTSGEALLYAMKHDVAARRAADLIAQAFTRKSGNSDAAAKEAAGSASEPMTS